MTRIQTLLLCGLGVVALSFASTANAAEIKNRKDCKAADGMPSRLGGVLTCTLPLLDAEFADSEKHVTSCDGELIGGGAFCQILIERKGKKLNCDAYAGKEYTLGAEYDAWRLEADTPMSKAWKCERKKRIKARRAAKKK